MPLQIDLLKNLLSSGGCHTHCTKGIVSFPRSSLVTGGPCKLLKMVEEALEIDHVTKTDFWRKVINKEMARVKIAWRIHEGHTPKQVWQGKCPELASFQEIRCHIVVDVKMDFTQKAQFVAGGHTTEAPALLTYSSIFLRDSVCLAFLIAALNGIDIMSCDLENAYLNAKCCKKIWFEAGTKCGEDKGKVCIVERALYGLKSMGAAFRAVLAQVLSDLGYESSRADPDVWLQKAMHDNGFE